MSVLKGDIAELEFEVQATRRRLVVSKPVITHDYDRIVDNGKRKFIRVQIKSCFSTGPRYTITIAKGSGSKQVYTKDNCDVIACFIDRLKSWYIFPIEALEGNTSITVYPDSVSSKWNKYRDSWGSLLN